MTIHLLSNRAKDHSSPRQRCYNVSIHSTNTDSRERAASFRLREFSMKNFFFVAILGGIAFGCSQELPTTPLPSTSADSMVASTAGLDAADVEAQRDRMREMLRQMATPRTLTAHEDFNCTNVEEVRVRFSDPGFIDRLNVGLFVKFVGMPAGHKTLRVWWNYATDFESFQDVSVGDGDVNPEDSSKRDVDMVVEHAYDTVGSKQVRVELILAGESGNCARNRDIFLTFESFDHIATFAGVLQCTTFPGRGIGIGVNFDPPIPTGTLYIVQARVDSPTAGSLPMITGFQNAAGTDSTMVGPVFAPAPQDFTATLTPTAPHAQLQVAADIFSPVSAISAKVLSIQIPGRTLKIVGPFSGTCP